MKTAKVILYLVSFCLNLAAIGNFVAIEKQADISAADRTSALWLFVGGLCAASVCLTAIAYWLDRIPALFSLAAFAKPVTFAIKDPARGVRLSVTLTDTELSKSDTEGRKKIGAVLEHYGSGGAA